VNAFTTGLGVIALAAGVGEFLRLDVPFLALVLVLVETISLHKTVTKQKA
jgi:hypothetical protein